MLVCPTNFDLQFIMSAKEAHIVQSATISVSEERQACKFSFLLSSPSSLSGLWEGVPAGPCLSYI